MTSSINVVHSTNKDGIGAMIAFNTTTPSTLQELFNQLDNLRNLDKPTRGQSNAAWALESSLDRRTRAVSEYKTRLCIEKDLVRQFYDDSIAMLPREELQLVQENQNGDILSTLSVMQHYGAPTRLLDWSFSPYISTFFACIENFNEDGAVWWFDKSRFESEEVAGKQWDELGLRMGPGFDIDMRKAFVDPPIRFWTTWYYPPHLQFVRMREQKGFFSLCGQLGLAQDVRMGELLGAECFGKIVISFRFKKEILKWLSSKFNIDTEHLRFHGADRLGSKLTFSLETVRKLVDVVN